MRKTETDTVEPLTVLFALQFGGDPEGNGCLLLSPDGDALRTVQQFEFQSAFLNIKGVSVVPVLSAGSFTVRVL